MEVDLSLNHEEMIPALLDLSPPVCHWEIILDVDSKKFEQIKKLDFVFIRIKNIKSIFTEYIRALVEDLLCIHETIESLLTLVQFFASK